MPSVRGRVSTCAYAEEYKQYAMRNKHKQQVASRSHIPGFSSSALAKCAKCAKFQVAVAVAVAVAVLQLQVATC